MGQKLTHGRSRNASELPTVPTLVSYGSWRPATQSNMSGVAFFVFLIFCGVGGLVLNDGIGENRLSQSLDNHGNQSHGVVMDHDPVRENSAEIDVRYSVGGETKLKSFEVTPQDYYRIKDGSPVTVAYLPQDPFKAKLVGYARGGQSPSSFIAAGAVLIGIGLLIPFALIVYSRSLPLYGNGD